VKSFDTTVERGVVDRKENGMTVFSMAGDFTDDGREFLRVANTLPHPHGVQKILELLAKICPISEKTDTQSRHVRITTLAQDLVEEGISEFTVNIQCKAYRKEKGSYFFPKHGEFIARCIAMQKNFQRLSRDAMGEKKHIQALPKPQVDEDQSKSWNDMDDAERYDVAREHRKIMIKEILSKFTLFSKPLKSMLRVMHAVPDSVDLFDYYKKVKNKPK